MGKGKGQPRVGTVSLLVILAIRPPDGVMAQAGTCHFRGTPEALAERPSPLDSVAIELGGDRALLCYGRPSARGRSIVGEQDPYGAPWRLGANEPTTLHLPFPASVGSVEVASGSYSLYAIPEETSWTIVVNRNTTRWGIPIDVDVRASDVGSFTVPVLRLDSHVETLEFAFEARDSHRGDLVYRWENTTFRIPIERR